MRKISKRGQLGLIEFQYFMAGFGIGLIGGSILTFLGTKKIIPFKVPIVCGAALFSKNKRAQLGLIEFQYFMVGFGVGLVGSLILIFLGTKGIIPFKIPLVCPALSK
jgi:hypothetical protein